MHTAREDALLLLLLGPVFRASSASGRNGRRTLALEILTVLLDPHQML